MGGEPYWYLVPFQKSVQHTLEALRQREFAAGRYNPVMPFLEFGTEGFFSAPGSAHPTIDAAREDAAEDGTRCILDIDHLSNEPEFCAASPFPSELVASATGSASPSREQVEAAFGDLIGEIERGHAHYLVLQRDGHPSEVFFAGYSFD